MGVVGMQFKCGGQKGPGNALSSDDCPDIRATSVCVCVCMFPDMATVHSGPTARYIKTATVWADLAVGLHELTMADELWTRCFLEASLTFLPPLPSSAQRRRYGSCVTPSIVKSRVTSGRQRWYQSDCGFAFFCFFCLTGCCLICSLAGTDENVGVWPSGLLHAK